MKYKKFYSKKKDEYFYLVGIYIHPQLFKDDLFCPYCLSAELYYKSDAATPHLAKKPSSEHLNWCRYSDYLKNISDVDFDSALDQDKSLLPEILESCINMTLAEEQNLETRLRTLRECNENLEIRIDEDNTSRIRCKTIETQMLIEKEDFELPTIFHGEVKLKIGKKADTFLVLADKNNKYIAGMSIPKITVKRLKKFNIHKEYDRNYIVSCRAKFKTNKYKDKDYINLIVQKDSDIEIIEIS